VEGILLERESRSVPPIAISVHSMTDSLARARVTPFCELERLITQKLLDVTEAVVKEELLSEDWQRRMAAAMGLSYEQARGAASC
jgi:hypothetical protein